MNNKLVILFILVIKGTLFSQKERVNWHFSTTNAGLYFNLSNSSVNTVNNYYTPYLASGSSVVSNSSNGTLQFYTDGKKVVDASHQIMPNGNGLMSGNATWGTGLAVPFPNKCNKYYVFTITTATESGNQGSLYYSVVDMNLQGNGTILSPLGDVETSNKNINLRYGVGECIEVIYNSSGNNYWLVISDWSPSSSYNGMMVVYKISATGISLHSTYNMGITIKDIQSISYNPRFDKCFVGSLQENDACYLLDFNVQTGNFTSFSSIPGTPFGTSTSTFSGISDAEWSPDFTKLYILKLRSTLPISGAGHIYQYDLNSPTNTPQIVFTPPNTYDNQELCTGIRRGPDGKIYFSYKSQSNPNIYIGCINNPNNAGSLCNLNSQQIVFSQSLVNTYFLFPRFVVRDDIKVSNLMNDTICSGQSVQLIASGGTGNYQWSGGAISNDDTLIVSPTVTTQYFVTSNSLNCGVNTDTITIFVSAGPQLSISNDTIVCAGQHAVLAAYGGTSYQWSQNGAVFSSNSTVNVYPINTTFYVLSSSNSCGTFVDSVKVTVEPNPILSMPNDSSICENQTINLLATVNGSLSCSWSNGIVNGISFVPPVGNNIYVFTVQSLNGCTVNDSVKITVFPLPLINAGSDIIACVGDSIILNGTGSNSLIWDNGIMNGVGFIPLASQTYHLTGVDDNGCINTDSVTVTVSPLPIANFIADTLSGCTPLLVAFTNLSSSNVINCIWSFEDGTTINDCDSVSKVFSSSDCQDVTLVVETIDGCTDSKTIVNYICPLVSPLADFLVNPPYLSNNNMTVNLVNTSLNATNYVWHFENDSSTIESPNHTFLTNSSNQYEIVLVAVNMLNGCIDTIIKQIYFLSDNIDDIPNIFTPDGDGINDYFQLMQSIDVPKFSCIIINRWGNPIISYKDSNFKWNGKDEAGNEMTEGVYFYIINATSYSGKAISKHGFVELKRK